jgi:hypothetical protein
VGSSLSATAGLRFAAFPLDAQITFEAGEAQAGPFAAVGGDLPAADDPHLRWTGPDLHAPPAMLTDEERERLKALGYVH